MDPTNSVIKRLWCIYKYLGTIVLQILIIEFVHIYRGLNKRRESGFSPSTLSNSANLDKFI